MYLQDTDLQGRWGKALCCYTDLLKVCAARYTGQPRLSTRCPILKIQCYIFFSANPLGKP